MSSEWPIPGVVRFLESVGFAFELDWDDELTIAYPGDLTGKTLADALAEHGAAIVRTVKLRSASERHQFMGGPYNGQHHGRCSGERIAINIRRGKWAVYLVAADGRAWFRGYATSRVKARRLEVLARQLKGSVDEETTEAL